MQNNWLSLIFLSQNRSTAWHVAWVYILILPQWIPCFLRAYVYWNITYRTMLTLCRLCFPYKEYTKYSIIRKVLSVGLLCSKTMENTKINYSCFIKMPKELCFALIINDAMKSVTSKRLKSRKSLQDGVIQFINQLWDTDVLPSVVATEHNTHPYGWELVCHTFIA